MTFDIEKPKTWKGLSYVLKSSILKDEITSRGIECNVHLIYWTPQLNNQTDCSIIEAEYWLPNQNVEHGRFYIRSGVVPSSERKKVETILINEVLPKLIDWVEIQVNTSIEATHRPGMFCAFYKEGELILN
ncbi:hypothetical protein [Aureibacter tunicatorum]|uniref:Uncharacterized protein n=1 Tax=Aureibacter tunicatorum TaxID=866807 RepID=A0AAE3XR62_9BACT|nr:hypothetical protein [Aureibacter tunicatorum]MDR6241102.1 hypothetical protein [Aureibacter tunicatorum]BDD03880.1 hypothetical protein AUTU_13630 [Aureibacter tunicatorum]